MKSIIAAMLMLLVMLQYELWYSEGGILSIVQMKHHMAMQADFNQKLKDRNMALVADIEDLRNGGQAIEERARNELGMVKQGEIFYQVARR